MTGIEEYLAEEIDKEKVKVEKRLEKQKRMLQNYKIVEEDYVSNLINGKVEEKSDGLKRYEKSLKQRVDGNPERYTENDDSSSINS